MKRSVLAIAIATVLAMVGCAMLWLYIRGADARVMADKEAARVLIATKRIPMGTTGAEIKTGGYAEAVTMPTGSLPSDALKSIDDNLAQLALNADVQPRQLLLRGAFTTPTETGGGLKIPEGKVAISVAIINNSGTVFLKPGTKIAIYDTFTKNEERGGMPAGDGLARDHNFVHQTRLLLPSVEVLATGFPGKPFVSNGAESSNSTSGDSGSGDTTGGDGKSGTDGTDSTKGTGVKEGETTTLVTVAVTQDEAERLILATITGLLYIAILDSSSTLNPGPGVDSGNLFN